MGKHPGVSVQMRSGHLLTFIPITEKTLTYSSWGWTHSQSLFTWESLFCLPNPLLSHSYARKKVSIGPLHPGTVILVTRVNPRLRVQGEDLRMDAVVQLPGITSCAPGPRSCFFELRSSSRIFPPPGPNSSNPRQTIFWKLASQQW